MNIKEKPIVFKESIIYLLFFLIGLTCPYIVYSIGLKTANLFSWEVKYRIYLLLSTPISIIFFMVIGCLLLTIKIYLKKLLYHIALFLIGMYLLCSFIEVEINFSKWKYVFNFYEKDCDSPNLLVNIFILIIMSVGLFFILSEDIKDRENA